MSRTDVVTNAVAPEAEMVVLGAILQDREASKTARAMLSEEDFFSDAHRLIYAAICDLSELLGATVDLITVTGELRRRRQLEEVGSSAYLAALIDAVPTTATVSHYARQIAEAAHARRVSAAAQELYVAARDHADGWQEHYEAVRHMMERTAPTAQDSACRSLGGVLAEVARASENGEGSRLIGSQWPTLNRLLCGGLAPGELCYLGAKPRIGKALALDTPLPTPTGWVTMEHVRVGTELFDNHGQICRVTAMTEVMHQHRCYRVTFSDGATIIADADHLWATRTRAAQQSEYGSLQPKHRASPFSRNQQHKRAFPGMVTTEEIYQTQRVCDGRANHAVFLASPLCLPDAHLPVPPYTLGAWLGDGKSTDAKLYSADPEILKYIRMEGVTVEPSARQRAGLCQEYRWGGKPIGPHRKTDSLTAILRKHGLLGNKHIPSVYLRSGEKQRRSLLAGLMDTDGWVSKSGLCEFTNTNKRIADGVHELIVSLGMQARWSVKRAQCNGKDCGEVFIVRFTPTVQIFKLSRKAKRWRSSPRKRGASVRQIVCVEPIDSVPVRCICVDSPSSLFLAGTAMIPTHNSAMMLEWARWLAQHGHHVMIVSCEMSLVALGRRIVAQAGAVVASALRRGHLKGEDYHRVAAVAEQFKALPVMMVSGARTVQAIERAVMSQRVKPSLLFVDYLQLLSAKGRDKRERIETISADLKQLAVQHMIPVVCLSSLRRPSADARDQPPTLSDLRESGELEHDADVILLLHRHALPMGMLSPDAVCIVAKARDAEMGTVKMRFDSAYLRYSEVTEREPSQD